MKKLVRNFKGIVFFWISKKLNFKSELKNVIILLTYRSGSAADTQAMTDIVKNQLEWYEIEFGNPQLPDFPLPAGFDSADSFLFLDGSVFDWKVVRVLRLIGGPVVRQSACPLWCHLLVRVELV